MAGRSPAEARALGLWTAIWLAGLLVAGLLWVGDLTLQWPVLVVPLLWALVALRPRRAGRGDGGHRAGGYRDDGHGDDGYGYGDDGYGEPPPPTRELRQLPRVPRDRGRHQR